MRKAVSRATRFALLAVVATVTTALPRPAAAQDVVVSVWYRGTPAGTPQQGELAAIRAMGFQAITWPASHEAGIDDVRRLANIVGLRVLLADGTVPLTQKNAGNPPQHVDVLIGPSTSNIVTPLVWSAIAHGARSIAFDSKAKTGAGLEEKNGALKPWAKAARDFSRQLMANANLVAMMRPGPQIFAGPAGDSDVVFVGAVLLDAGRSWVIVATNFWNRKTSASIRLPKGVPYALWVNWLGGPPLAMISEPAGPRWMVTMAPRSAQVYIIDKQTK